MTPRQRKQFLKLIAGAHDPEAAAASLGLPLSVVDSPELQAEVRQARRVGLALMRSKLTELALQGNDVRALQTLLERREAGLAEDDGVRRIERVIINAKCQACGHEQFHTTKVNGTPEVVGEFELARRLAFAIAKGAQPEEAVGYHPRKKLSDPPKPVETHTGNGEAKPPKRSYLVEGGI